MMRFRPWMIAIYALADANEILFNPIHSHSHSNSNIKRWHSDAIPNRPSTKYRYCAYPMFQACCRRLPMPGKSYSPGCDQLFDQGEDTFEEQLRKCFQKTQLKILCCHMIITDGLGVGCFEPPGNPYELPKIYPEEMLKFQNELLEQGRIQDQRSCPAGSHKSHRRSVHDDGSMATINGCTSDNNENSAAQINAAANVDPPPLDAAFRDMDEDPLIPVDAK